MLGFFTGLYFGVGIALAYISLIIHEDEDMDYTPFVQVTGALAMLFLWLPINIIHRVTYDKGL